MSKSWKLKEVLENFGTILENFGKVLENFGTFWENFGTFWENFGIFFSHFSLPCSPISPHVHGGRRGAKKIFGFSA